MARISARNVFLSKTIRLDFTQAAVATNYYMITTSWISHNQKCIMCLTPGSKAHVPNLILFHPLDKTFLCACSLWNRASVSSISSTMLENTGDIGLKCWIENWWQWLICCEDIIWCNNDAQLRESYKKGVEDSDECNLPNNVCSFQ